MKRILVVGGAGYVGSVLVRQLIASRYWVRIVDRCFFGNQGIANLYNHERISGNFTAVELVKGDMRNLDISLFDGMDAVINIGGLSNDPTAEYNPKANDEMNRLGTVSLAMKCKERGVRRYVFASSCSIYDSEQDDLLDETAKVYPTAPYSRSKYDAEKLLLEMADESFCPVVLRKGTIYGFSPRMRYDLVVNTFVKGALSKGEITIFRGGEMWRPLIDVRDVARAYIKSLEAPEDDVRAQIINISAGNYRISELAFRVREALQNIGIHIQIRADYTPRTVRSYRVATEKAHDLLHFHPVHTVEESVRHTVERIRAYKYTDFENPRYYNIRWMKLLDEVAKETSGCSIFDVPRRE